MKKYNAQDVLNKFYHHFIKMNNPQSIDETGMCRYRIDTGDKKVKRCAIGIFIPKKLYDPKMEGTSACYVNREYQKNLEFIQW